MLYVVTGPPTAGKSSWITAHATPADIVIDMDRLAVALAGPGADGHRHGKVLTQVAHRARFAAMTEAFKHLDQVDVYLIHTLPDAKARAKYSRLGARIITVDPGREVVMQRVRALRQPGMERVVTRWYRAHPPGGAHIVTGRASRAW